MITNLRVFQEVLKRNNLPTPDTYLGISELIRSLYRPDVSPNPERIREVLEELTWPISVPAGNPITFKSCSEVLASEALVTFAPKQSGTGDPSPSNIRPFVLWQGVSLATRQNYYTSQNYVNGAINTGDGVDSSSRPDRLRTSGSNIVEENTQYGLYITSTKEIEFVAYFYKLDGTYIGYNGGWLANKSSFTTPANTGRVRFAFRFKDESNISASNMSTNYLQLTATATFDAPIPGGSYDFVSGEGFETWDYIASYAGETLPGEWMSDRDVYAEGTTPTTGAEVAYITNTPTPISLTPTDVNLLKGLNTVWTDGDTVQIKFQILK